MKHVVHLSILACVCTTMFVTAASMSTAKDDSSSEESGESKEKSTSGQPPTETAASPTSAQPFVCTYLNRTYSLGEQIQTPDTPCLHCTCTKRWTKPSGTSCAIIDCPFAYYRSRPHCKTEYVEGKCCPELECAPPQPGLETELLSRKKPRTSTDKMVITAAPGKEVTLYCIAQTDGDKALDPNLATWTRQSPTDKSPVTVELSSRIIAKFFPPSTWGLLIDHLEENDTADYTCQVATTPPQTYKTTLRVEVRSPVRMDVCSGPTQPQLAPGAHTCDQLTSNGWYYNESRFMCEEYEKKPCKKPVNYFSSRHECYDKCADACYDQKQEGLCDVREKRYYYDHVKDECNSFIYNGCKGNRNNFETKDECENKCVDVKFRILDVEGRATPVKEPEQELPPCHNLQCPWHQWFHYMWKGCKAITKPNACCPHRFECSSTSEAVPQGLSAAQPAEWNLGSYHCSSNFADKYSVSVSKCLTCSCDSSNHTFSCKVEKDCFTEESEQQMRDNCVPVYVENECCPHEYRCPRPSSFPQHGPQEDFKEEPELRCKYGERTYPRNYELILEDPCTTCTCLTPPDFTCTIQKCPLHPSAVNATLRCEIKAIHGPQCCPEYECWDIIEKPLVIGKPQTPKELEVCTNNLCEEHHSCNVNYTACYLGNCERTCRMCPSPLCASGAYLEEVPHDCPVCAGYKTPEEACDNFDGCPPDSNCRVDEDRCRNEGRCDPFCELESLSQIFIAVPETVCPMPRCPPSCGFKNGTNGCRQCDCTIPRGPIQETPCIKVCPQDCGQKVQLDGCLECLCDNAAFLGTGGPTPEPPSNGDGSNTKECIRECPQDCAQTVREDGCLECNCNVGPFFGNHGTPKPPPGANLHAVDKIPCASVSCTFPCWAAPAEADGCSKTCLCPKTAEEACTKLDCPKESKCIADCDGVSCKPKCELQLQCPEVICDAGCTQKADDQGCKTLCECS